MESLRFAIFSARRYSTKSVVNWSAPGKFLSVEQKQFYKKNGFLLIRNCIGKEDLKRYEDRFNAICERKVTPPESMLVMKDVSIAKKITPDSIDTITKVQDFTEEPVLFSYCEHPRVTDVVRDLVGSSPSTRIQAMHTMLINKPPDTGALTSRHPMHQDLIYFPWRPEDLTICAWTAMEKVGHYNQQKERMSPSGARIAGRGAQRARLSGLGGFRKAISCHYANDDICRYVNVEGTTQENLAQEIIDIAKKRMARYGANPDDVQLDFADIWRVRAREVNGRRSNL